MAALPDTPARMSRSAALHQLFNTKRNTYPPSEPKAVDGTEETGTSLQNQVASSDPLSWRPNSWFAPQEISNITTSGNPEGLTALYKFDEGEGTIVRDQSGSANPLDLHMQIRAGSNWEDLDQPGPHGAGNARNHARA